MPNLPTPDSTEFASFSDRLSSAAFATSLAERVVGVSDVQQRLSTSIAEARQTLLLLGGVSIPADAKILEIGAGLGLTSCFLALSGFEVTALEPGGVGFEAYAALSREIAIMLGAGVSWIDHPAEDLDPGTTGPFALVFSNNVLEHVVDPRLVLERANEMLTRDGLSIHSCPNYSVPYEPHFGLPLLPVKPAWTAKLLPSSVRDSGLWRSLNFIQAKQIVRWTGAGSNDVHFRAGALAESLERLNSDQEFRSRHRLMAVAASAVKQVGVIAIARRLPATWSTPMDFMVCGRSVSPEVVAAWRDRVQTSIEPG